MVKNDTLLGWTSGFVTSGTYLVTVPTHPLTDFALKILATIALGFAGGFAGVAGKYLFARIFKQAKNKSHE